MNTEELYLKYRECGCRVTTDSRAISGGEMFIALKGENFDGNEYALKALEAGGKAGHIRKSGTVDDCKDNIIGILEGGKEAFEKRVERYTK